MKRMIAILIMVIMLFITGCSLIRESVSLMEYGEFAKIREDNIKQIEIVRYTVMGDDSTIVDEESIKNVYHNLQKKKIGRKTNMVCEDNTTVYIFTLEDDNKIKIEIECDWVIIGKDRYLLD